MRTKSGLAALALASTLLTGCGGTSAYCEQLESDVEYFQSFEQGDVEQLDEAFDRLRELGDEAPSEVEDDWKTLVEGIDTIESALDDVGLEPGDLAGLQQGDLPEGVEQEDLVELGAQLQELSSDRFSEAGDAISEHAKEECDVDLEADAEQ